MTRRADDVPSNGFIWQAVQQNQVVSEDGHKRIRADLDRAEERIGRLELALAASVNAITRIETRPVDASSLIFSMQSLIAIIIGILAIVSGSWLVNWSERSRGERVEMLLNTRSQSQDKINDELRSGIATVQKELKATEDRLRGEIRLKAYDDEKGKRR